MNDKIAGSVHWSFWLVGVVALVWNVGGCVNYIIQMNADSLAAYREVEQAIIQGRPAWATAGFGLAVFGGALGSLLLLLRKPAAYYLFIASLLGVIVTSIHTLGVASATDFSAMEMVVIVLMPVVVAALLVWYSKRAENKGWLKLSS